MSRRGFRRWIAVLLASAVAVLAPVPLLTQTAQADPGTPIIPASYLDQAVTWRACPAYGGFDEFESRCATVRVPMDWQNTTKGDISIAIAFMKSTSANPKGLLTSNPGGPGAAGRMLTESLAWSKPQMFDYDLLGFDPRGFGASTPVKCLTSPTTLKKLPEVADRRVRSKATHAVEVAEAKLFGKACATEANLTPKDPKDKRMGARYVTTQQTVWDLDFLRQLVAKNQNRAYPVLNYIGYSYGTWLGAWYADTYPKNVGRFILDSNMQWTSSMDANQALDPKSFQRRRDKMLFPYLARHNADFGLGKSVTKVKKNYESTRKKLVKQAKKDLKKGKTPAFGPNDLDFVTAQLIYTDDGMNDAGDLIKRASKFAKKPTSVGYQRALAKRSATVMKHAPFVVQRSAAKVNGSSVAIDGLAGAIVTCNDSTNPSNIKKLQQRTDRDARRYPFMGYFNTVSLCAYWKFKPQTRTIDLAGVGSKIMMIQSEGDPATAYEGALAAHRRTAGKTVLVSVDNGGQHALYIDGPSKCVESTGDAYLFRGTVPSKDTRCTTSPLFYDSKVYPLNGPVSGATSNVRKAIKPKNGAVKTLRANAAKRELS